MTSKSTNIASRIVADLANNLPLHIAFAIGREHGTIKSNSSVGKLLIAEGLGKPSGGAYNHVYLTAIGDALRDELLARCSQECPDEPGDFDDDAPVQPAAPTFLPDPKPVPPPPGAEAAE